VLPQHENEFDIVLDHRIRFVGLTKEAGAVLDLVRGIGNFVPDDWGEIVEADSLAVNLNRRMKRHNSVTTTIHAPG
jgi:hypothetical protein